MFSNDDNDFLLTNQEGKSGLKRGTMTGLYILLGIVVLVTGTHAIMLVLSQAPDAAGAESGLLTAILNAIRISFPVTMELAAVVAGLGFISAKWRKGQKAAAFGVELTWIIFAAANMITFFRVERGLPLEGWQTGWINYGLPLTSLIAGVLTYSLTRTDPDLKRKDEETAANEKITMIRFAARRDVEISPQRQAIEKQRAWIDFVKELRSAGYTELQIRYMLQDTPELLIDQDKDGRMDLLEDAPPSPSLPDPNASHQTPGDPRRPGINDVFPYVGLMPNADGADWVLFESANYESAVREAENQYAIERRTLYVKDRRTANIVWHSDKPKANQAVSNASRQTPVNGMPRRTAATTPPLPTETRGGGADSEVRTPFE